MPVFQKGRSGNPKGRPKAPPDFSAFRKKLAQDSKGVLLKMQELALAGDVNAARILLDRCIPAYRAIDPPLTAFTLPDGPPSEQARAVLHAMADGVLSPSVTVAIISAITAVEKLEATTPAQPDPATMERQQEAMATITELLSEVVIQKHEAGLQPSLD